MKAEKRARTISYAHVQTSLKHTLNLCPDTTFLISIIVIRVVFYDDEFQKVLGLQNVILKEQKVVTIKSVCSSNDTFFSLPCCGRSIRYQVIQLCEVYK